MANSLNILQLPIGGEASFHGFSFLTRSGEQEVTLSGSWLPAVHSVWIAEAEKLGMTVVDKSSLLHP